MHRRLAFALALLLTSGTAAGAQQSDSVPARVRARLHVVDSTRIQVLHLRDGSTLVGRITAVDANGVRFRGSVGESTFAPTMIRRIDEVPASALRPSGDFWFPNPNATRRLFAPTGRMLSRGAGYFSDCDSILPGVAVGVTDRVTFGGGMSLVPSGSTQLFYVTFINVARSPVFPGFPFVGFVFNFH